MLKKALCGLVFSAFVAIFASPAFGWDETGHKITAYIAWQQMTPDVRARVVKILLDAPEDAQLSTFYMPYGTRDEETRKREFFMFVATWPDVIRDRNFPVRFRKFAHSNWHYSDTLWTVKDGKIEYLKAPEEGGLAMEKLNEFDKLIRGDGRSPEKAVAIAWLEHLIGDIHQPLHASGRVTDLEPKGDQGANLFLLTPKDQKKDKLELHWFWDSIIGRNMANTKNLCDADYIDPIAQKIMKMYPFAKLQSELLPGKFEDWAHESLTLAQTEVYSAHLKRFEMPSDKYKKKALQIAERRMALAGYRMGELFNSAFGVSK
jgi:S1/P1 Nuclease